MQLLFVASLTSLAAVLADDTSPDVVGTIDAVTQIYHQQAQDQHHQQMTSTLPIAASNSDFQSDHSNTKNRRKRRGIFGEEYSGDNGCSYYWKDVAVGKRCHSFYDDMDIGPKEKNRKKKRIGFLHFGRINQSSVFERSTNKGIQGEFDSGGHEEDHPLRTKLWEINLNWSLFAPKSKRLSCSSAGQRGKSLEMELHPEGYCRLIEDASNRNNSTSNAKILGIGRWKKRPWGVTIVVRPLLVPKSSLCAGKSNANDDTRYDNKENTEKSKHLFIVDEATEFVFHARGFHWNGFGSNPKLTQGTILLQKRIKEGNCFSWWKSSTLTCSSIFPLWPEEVSGEVGDEEIITNTDKLGSTYSNMLKSSRILNMIRSDKSNCVNGRIQRRWFRPVVGTFTATGII